MKTWLITGASSGLGAALAHAVLDRGDNAVVTARNADHLDKLTAAYPDTTLAVSLDVGDSEQVVAAVDAATARFGGVDVLVNNAGHGYRAAVEEAEVDEVEELFATNFFGPVDLIKRVLPQMRARRAGTIVNVSSIGAPRSNPASGYYTATKAALEGVSDALRREVEPLGIRVLILEPGAFRTDFSGRSLKQSRTVISDYADTAGKRRIEKDTTHGTQRGDPDRAATLIIDAVHAEVGPFRLLLGSDAIHVVREELQGRIDEIDAWAHLSVTTDFPKEDKE
ncbi:oxidoreductase [Microbacterium invictum]|uniref:NAD(P)-dependent dehydrogenase (Short-subunit alcohol dehydrogenase family) n=1 Tax=Microbacterium invictum TaxID=515415 RepID=A0AA40SRW1_9MICO|nr:oxidoreductase [Microbacterium invictum]MBB4141310.1 NAD(P)-dependent dehydrogenase (short-subunit alcohol dehydrogenase family) [Microbacterium invictum]